jgi:hypothetical protein
MSPFKQIENVTTTEQAIALKKAHPGRALMFTSKNPESQWDELKQMHHLLASQGLPLLNLFKAKKSEMKMLNDLQNAEAVILSYSKWMSEEMEAVSSSFCLTRMDEYQLEAKMKDYHHEVQNPLLVKAEEVALACLKEKETPESEKERVRSQMVMQKCLEPQKRALVAVLEGIGKIEAGHPGLKPLKIKLQAFLLFLNGMQDSFSTEFLNCLFKADSLEESRESFLVREAMRKVFSKFKTSSILHCLENFDHFSEKIEDMREKLEAKEYLIWSKTAPEVSEFEPLLSIFEELYDG